MAVGETLVAILAGNVVSNLILTYLSDRLGKRRLLQLFSAMIVVSGGILAAQASLIPILIGCLVGNISTTGTEAGPFQSIEAGALPELVDGGASKAFGNYNLIGYSASAIGSFAAGTPDYIPMGLIVYQWMFLGFALVGVFLFFLYSTIRSPSFSEPSKAPALSSLSEQGRKDLTRLSALFSLDAFGGSFVSVYVLSAYFFLRFHVTRAGLADIFSVTSIIVVASVFAASRIAAKVGNLRTMVFTHLVSSAFLLAIPFAGSLYPALGLLFLRQSVSQMDVPTRQALMAEMFDSDERVPAFAISNTARNIAAFAGGPVNTALLVLGYLSGILFAGGTSKVVYDVSIYLTYRRRFR